MAEDEMVKWSHGLDGHEFEPTPRDREGQRSLMCCSSRGHKESDTTEWLNHRAWCCLQGSQELLGGEGLP